MLDIKVWSNTSLNMNNKSTEQAGVHIIMKEVFLYKDRMNSFGSSIAQRSMPPLILRMTMICNLMQPLYFATVLTNIYSSECELEGHLLPSCSHDGSGGGGDGGNGGANEMGASNSSRPSIDYFSDLGCGATLEDDRRSRNSPDEQPTQIYYCLREGPGLFASSSGYDIYSGVLNDYGYKSTYTNCPPLSYPSNEP
ncbi:hypothetical protein Cgig2_011718 [Carnegiea gigantea]|uniref:Uncharacterized protein n=1 Tax=Carnegiea gigantea TaxID=171969 RepID=A0A9Q1GKM7_9CARY|nr:hypothetical protein Cgig2_011718 [Carnegiea gigantea]